MAAEDPARSRPGSEPFGALAARCAACLDALYGAVRPASKVTPDRVYSACVSYIIRALAILIAAGRIPPQRSAYAPIQRAARLIGDGDASAYEEACTAARKSSGLGIFDKPKHVRFGTEAFAIVSRMLTRPCPDAPIEQIYFETMPLSWLGSAYQAILALRPDETGEKLQPTRAHRKKRGVYFTPPSLVSYVVEGVLAPLTESRLLTLSEPPARIAVLDPAMGGGDFLTRVVEYLLPIFERQDAETTPGRGGPGEGPASYVHSFVYGVDVDARAVEIARFSVWASTGFPDGIADSLNSRLVCANAIGARHAGAQPFDWAGAFPEVFAEGGFDAVVGNPPYIAAKNGLAGASASGQSDTYLLFLSEIMESRLVKPGGLLSMVLPDPMLVRENAASIRRKIVTEWSVISLLHISEAFPDALVANVVPIIRNAAPTNPTFLVSRIERAADRRSFAARPIQTATELATPVRLQSILVQERCEFLYLLEQGIFGEIIRRIHGSDCALSQYNEPFAPLRKLNVKAIYRGEEVGKAAIRSETGNQPVLLGGQSIQPYEIIWEGHKAGSSWIRKPLERYHSTKILIQKSSPRLIAALDRVTKRHPGYVFPQSVYAVELTEHGMDPLYLLCLLNSKVLNEYVWRTVTGHKLLQPQLELEDIRALPIRRISFSTQVSDREAETARGIGVFESESLRGADFAELANFVVGCLTGIPERSDVVHDLLVHLGREIVSLTRANRRSPDASATHRLESLRAAVETIVWQLYSSEPSQMFLPW